ncbi:Zn-dependent oxidoreductase [Halomicroarcula sp. GCM10025709]|uniref:Zn-dependent oxidoreductase n=1 Tax=Halomicroarcula sp. GCM10025709 TaxID=3252669 RepID=UPI0036154A01
MSQHDSESEVTCTLTEEQEAKGREEIRARLVEHYLGSEDHESGVVVRFDGTDTSLEALAEFTASELQCCSFAAYEITVSPPSRKLA